MPTVGSTLLHGEGEARAHAVSTVTIGSQIEPSVCGARKNSHDVVPVIRFGGSPGWFAADGRGVAMGHLVGGLVSLIASPFLAVDASS